MPLVAPPPNFNFSLYFLLRTLTVRYQILYVQCQLISLDESFKYEPGFFFRARMLTMGL